jgi:hypothetical protein
MRHHITDPLGCTVALDEHADCPVVFIYDLYQNPHSSQMRRVRGEKNLLKILGG